MRRHLSVSVVIALAIFNVLEIGTGSLAADLRSVAFEVRETAGIRRRNDVITLRLSQPAIVNHSGGFRLLLDDAVVPIQVRRVQRPGESPEVVIDFIGHFPALATAQYVLQLIDEPTTGEPTEGLTLVESDDAYTIDSGGLVTWTIRKDLAGLLDFSWKETDYIADDSAGLFFTDADDQRTLLASRPPTRVAVERQGPLATSLVFDYDEWPPGAHSRVHLEFPRTKSWIHATWTIEGAAASTRAMGAELNLRLDGPEALLDFGAGDFVYATVTKEQAARLEAGARFQGWLPWKVLHGPADQLEPIFVAPMMIPTPAVHGWAHVMDDKRATALAIADFGEADHDVIHVDGDGRLSWTRRRVMLSKATRTLEFWLHFVTMPVHIGARTSPRSMQEPLEIVWPAE